MSEWNNAGKLFRIEGGGPWFDSNIRFKMALKQHPQLMEQPQVKDILKDFVKPWGDRRQEVVIIGVGIEEEKVSALLDACLLTEEEMKAGAKAWKQYPDPLPQWQKLPFEYEEEKEEEEDAKKAMEDARFRNLRFKVGDRVECCVAPEKWAPGKVVKIKYRGANWPKNRPTAPYQIEVGCGADAV